MAQINAGGVTSRGKAARHGSPSSTPTTRRSAARPSTSATSSSLGPRRRRRSTVTGVSIDPGQGQRPHHRHLHARRARRRWDAADNGGVHRHAQRRTRSSTTSTTPPRASARASTSTSPSPRHRRPDRLDRRRRTSPAAGGSTHKVTVDYADDVGVNLLSIGPNDLSITGPRGDAGRAQRHVDANADGTQSPRPTRSTPPGRTWGPEDNGTYQVSLNADQVRDGIDNGATAPAATFNVNIAAARPDRSRIRNGGGGGGGGGHGGGGRHGRSAPGGGAGGGGQPTPFIAEAVVAQPDGKILVAGRQGNLADGTSQGVIQRFNADGTLDTTFGTRGKVVTAAGANDAFYAIALGDGRRASSSPARAAGDVLVSKYDADRQARRVLRQRRQRHRRLRQRTDDAAYALGVARRRLGRRRRPARAATSRSPSSCPAACSTPASARAACRCSTSAPPTTRPAPSRSRSDKIVIVGTSGGKVAVVRLRANGEADETFSGDGLLLLDGLAARTATPTSPTAPPPPPSRPTASCCSPTARPAAISPSPGSTPTARSTRRSAPAASRPIDFGGDDDADAVLVQDTGEILVIGTTNAGGVANTAVAALDTAGDADRRLRHRRQAHARRPTLGASSARELHIGDLVLRAFGTRQPDGRVVVGSSSSNPSVSAGSGPAAAAAAAARAARACAGSTSPARAASRWARSSARSASPTASARTLTVTDADGTKLTFSASRGAGTVYRVRRQVQPRPQRRPAGAAVDDPNRPAATAACGSATSPSTARSAA